MKIDILVSDHNHPVIPSVKGWMGRLVDDSPQLISMKAQASGGDLLFLVSCTEIVPKTIRRLYRNVLVLHASDLPEGRGWSPHIWQILEGRSEIVVSLLEAEDAVDTGAIWRKETFELEGHELHDEINQKLFDVEIRLMDWAVRNINSVVPTPQLGQGTSWRKRTPKDSCLDPQKTIAEQFNILRVADPERYPAFFEMNGQTYKVKIERMLK